MEDDTMNEIERLLALTEKAVSPFHTAEAVKETLEEKGFAPLCWKEEWNLQKGGKYYIIHHGTTIFAFTIGEDFEGESIRMAAAHGDFPGFRLKPSPEMKAEAYLKLNTEPYGGVNLASWMDRPLSIAGRVAVKSEDVFHPDLYLVDFEKPVLTIPNIAIHLDRDMNKGRELNRQTQMLPLAGMAGQETTDGYMKKLLADKLHVMPEDILEYELNIYNADTGTCVGFDGEFVSAPRLDDLTSVQAIIDGITKGVRREGLNVSVVFDHEEIGSRTKQGAGSTLLMLVLERIYEGLSIQRTKLLQGLSEGMLLSVDVAHGLHPNYQEKADPTNHPVLNGGFCIKESSSQSYATDCEAVGIVQSICDREGIPYQKFANRSDGTGGGTLGAIASAMIPVKTVDIGVPLLAMHSSRELMGRKDMEALSAFSAAFFTMDQRG
ncbi:M18 family aminopeptidase [Sellimonas caecigallum]|uniref:M18 family aminopeptidase n=2 Tax=Sellimonas caecigallum TaxID=2592333 RepID=A0ABS7L4I9_9FIRM|nr:M18 family aminopeptidase [Sellimonas caecigallum]